MRIALSDFDGTLYQNHKVLDTDIEAVRLWRQAGHLFGIATGRDLSMTVHEIQKWSIPFDFLVCNNGAIVYDKNFTILTSRNMDDTILRQILATPVAHASVHWQFCIDGVVKLYPNTAHSWFPELGVPFIEIDREQALALTRVQQVSFAYETDSECAKWVAMLNAEFPCGITLQPNVAFVDITGPNISKETGIADLIAAMGWDKPEVFVIGDAENDLAMIRAHSGFTVPHAKQIVKDAAKAIYPNLGAMFAAITSPAISPPGQ